MTSPTPAPHEIATRRGNSATRAIAPQRGIVPPLLPVLLPIVIAAIASSILLAWLLPPARSEDSAPVARFDDVTTTSGIDFVYKTGNANADESPTTLGGGVVCFDFDQDGDVDLFFVNRAPWPWEDDYATRENGRCRLFQNDGSGAFTDVSERAGLDVEILGMSASAGDYDNDGFPDLFVSSIGQNLLFHNKGDGTFDDVSQSSGTGGDANTWSTGGAWIDIDEDGWLDLVVCHYARWPEEVGLQMAFVVANVGRTYGTPTGFVGAFPTVFQNNRDGTFTAIADEAGLRDIDAETGLPVPGGIAAIPTDANGDTRLDLIFTYHADGSSLFLNQGGGTFRKAPINLENRREGASADLSAASQLSLTRSTGRDEKFSALATLSGADEEPIEPGWANLGKKGGVAFLDYDFDGRLDLFDGNGRAEPDTHRFENGRNFARQPTVLWNRGVDWAAAAIGDDPASPAMKLNARGVATADFDSDGDFDVVISSYDAPAVLLKNNQRLDLPWLQIDLEGKGSPYGARVEVHTPRRIHSQTLVPGNGLFAQSESTLLFGLSEDTRVQKVVVRWPDGTRQETTVDGINRRVVIAEP